MGIPRPPLALPQNNLIRLTLMKILLLNYEFPPLGGGAGRATYHLADHLARLGHMVHVLAPKAKHRRSVVAVDGFKIFPVTSIRKSVHDCGFRGALSYVAAAAREVSNLALQYRYDILHYFFCLPTGLLTLFPGAHRKIPYIISLRGSDVPHYDVYNRRLEIAHFCLSPLTRHVLKRARRVIAVTNSLKATAHQTFPQQKISVIPNGVDDELFKPKPPGDVGGPLKLVCVARLVPRKGIQHLLAALTDFENGAIALSIFGTGSHATWLKNRCRELGLQDCVTFHGYTPRLQLAKHLAASDVFVLPSLAEAFGNVFAEAMACGLPVIGTTIGGIPDLVQAKNGILVTPGDVGEIRTAIRQLSESPNLRKQMGAANRLKIINEYAWQRIAERFLSVYAEASLPGSTSI